MGRKSTPPYQLLLSPGVPAGGAGSGGVEPPEAMLVEASVPEAAPHQGQAPWEIWDDPGERRPTLGCVITWLCH